MLSGTSDDLSFTDLAPAVRVLWAKSGEPVCHGLLAHLLDVAAVAEVLLERESQGTTVWFANLFGLPPSTAARTLAALAGLHDFGKATPGFQNKWCLGRDRDKASGLPFSSDLGTTDHALASAKILEEHLSNEAFPRPWVNAVLQALSAHHGYNFATQEIDGVREPRSDEWLRARKLLFAAYWKSLAPNAGPDVEELPLSAVEWLAGLTSISDWIASNPEWFPLGERADGLYEHFLVAKALAGQALSAIGWPPYRSLLTNAATTSELITKMLAGSQGMTSPRPLQVEGDRLLQEAKGATLLLVEAPMGEGKTELAFLAHLRLQLANQHRGLYVALPTQATGTAMFDRTEFFLRAFSSGMKLDMQLVHGASLLSERVEHLRGIWGDDGEADDSIRSSAWFSQRRRSLISPYGVGTVDQALLCTLNVKHHFVRIWGLSNRVVILDEVHAYDTYTTGLIENMLRWLKELGCSVVLMSATLSQRDRNSLMAAWGVGPHQIPELAYPRVIAADAEKVRGTSFASRPMPPIHLYAVSEDVESLAACALGCLDGGGRGAVIVNTVDRAQKLFQFLHERVSDDVDLMLFHARYPAETRSEQEAKVLGTFGGPAASTQRPGKMLLIATQVAEQSLDIDFDFLLTDLAPVDLVLQRAGRLHRHERARPEAHRLARLYVAGLSPEYLPNMKTTAWEFVYDPYILGRTWAFLSRETMLCMPSDIDRLVQLVYDKEKELPKDVSEQAQSWIEGDAWGEHLARSGKQRQQAINAPIDPRDEPQNAYLSKPRGYEQGDFPFGVENRTRLGDDSIALVPVHVGANGWSIVPSGETFNPDAILDDAYAKRLFLRQIKLSRRDVVTHFARVELPRAFSNHPLLQHLKPMPLKGGIAFIGTFSLLLDPVLGVVYEKMDPLSLKDLDDASC